MQSTQHSWLFLKISERTWNDCHQPPAQKFYSSLRPCRRQVFCLPTKRIICFFRLCLSLSMWFWSINSRVCRFYRVITSKRLIVSGNPFLVYGILKTRKKFEALRTFTLESGQQEIERQNQLKKAASSNDGLTGSAAQSIEDLRRSSGARSPLTHIPEENSPFAIGGDDSDDDGEVPTTPSQSSPSLRTSRAPSISSSLDDSVPLQVRGMSEKARGKMPAGQMGFSRQNSLTSLSSYSAAIHSTPAMFTPTAAWVRLPFTRSCTATNHCVD